MKRKELIKHLVKNGCELLREGGRHSIYVNHRLKKVSAMPRHIEIDDKLARKICRDLSVLEPKRKK